MISRPTGRTDEIDVSILIVTRVWLLVTGLSEPVPLEPEFEMPTPSRPHDCTWARSPRQQRFQQNTTRAHASSHFALALTVAMAVSPRLICLPKYCGNSELESGVQEVRASRPNVMILEEHGGSYCQHASARHEKVHANSSQWKDDSSEALRLTVRECARRRSMHARGDLTAWARRML